MLRWDLTTDRVEAGQWFLGSVAFGTSAISPDGKLILYSARKRGERFTVISRPPYFTALAYWEESLPWTGGGFFADSRHVVMGVTGPPQDGHLPENLEVSDIWSYFAWQGNGRSHDTFGDAVLKQPDAHQGWLPEPTGWAKSAPNHPSRQLVRSTGTGQPGVYRLIVEGRATDLGELDWADFAPDGALLMGLDGCLYRHAVGQAESHRVANLSDHSFTTVPPAPFALRWP